tara:strand:+ start:284 stop:832 length:549 start_codon:yes stop_codon:yes gene_type:complete
MARNIHDFKEKTKGQFARANLFKVEITPQLEASGKLPSSANINFLCNAVQIPGLSMTTTERALDYKIRAKQKLYDDITLSFYGSEELPELDYFNQWLNLMVNPKTNRVGYYNNYIATVTIKKLSKQGLIENDIAHETILHDAFPKKIDPISLDYGSTDIVKIGVTFGYRYYTFKSIHEHFYL